MENLIYNDWLERMKTEIEARRAYRAAIHPAAASSWYLENWTAYDALMAGVAGEVYGNY